MTDLGTRPAGGAAHTIAALLAPTFGGQLPIRIQTWDGAIAGPDIAPTLVLANRQALRRLLWAPPELAVAQAYVTGEIDFHGDLRGGLRLIRGAIQQKPPIARLLAQLMMWGAIGPRPEPPVSQAHLRGRLHSKRRDAAVIAHHYDLSNEFYSLILDESMAYSCGYWRSDDPDYSLADAQRDKLDLICRKLGMRRGTRHLDIGCGWGSLSLHAAEHFGANVLAVTLSEQQQEYVQARIRERGLQGLVEVRRQDYRDIPDGQFDSVSSIEMGEHVGAGNYPAFTSRIADLLKPGGRVLIQQMSRRSKPGGGPFIEAFIAPDMDMRPVGETVAMIEDAGLEVRDVQALREHYARTADAWYDTFERNWDRVVGLVGEEVARVWRLYLVGGSLAFEDGRMGVDQILSVKPGGTPPPTPEWHVR
ncbi:SAM-dependent methyltransferase [Smaragdicoccus niigatensis]|uniref:SAM-dependent methyltransferase n=1 Tax=Smaragdicoccus niigatensis TaxID=359359 RepID=UPI00037DB52F|nr:cyclopropane-fatty-acyl-phospholipid synthase family protein [Smaragdicoccus niigatensis]